MQRNYVLTLSGPDRIGIVEMVTGLLLDRGGNVETSRMARLGGEFAILMLVSMPAERYAGLDADLQRLITPGYRVTTTLAQQTHAEPQPAGLPYRIEVHGADHEGIIHEVARYLSQHEINIESMDSETTPAPLSGAPLFTMTAHVAVPPHLSGRDWQTGLESIGNRLNLEVGIFAIEVS
jgi:glycine cleavage system transcriptional repressor